MAKKRATLKEIKAPDEFQEAMGKVVEFFRLYGGWVGAAAGVVLVAILLGVFLSRHQESAAIDAGRQFDKAAGALLKPADPTPPGAEAPAPAVDPAGAATTIQAFIDEHKGSALAGTALLARGTAAMQAGDFPGAMAAFKGFIEAHPESGLAMTVWEAYGDAADRAGNRAEAEAAYRKMVESTQALHRVYGHLHLGDLVNPSLQAEGADAAKAREAYTQGLAAITGEDDALPAAQLIARKTLAARLRNLP